MKKVLALLLVCLLATSVAFAAVQFSGSLTAGAAINYDKDRADNDGWRVYTYGDDGDDSDEMSLNFTLGDDQGLWSADVKGLWGGQLGNTEQLFGESGKIEAIFKTNIAKVIATAVGGESPIDVTLEAGGNRRVTTLRAYANASGANLDRVRTINNTSPFGLTIGYQDFVQAQVTYAPELWDDRDSSASAYPEDLTASLLVKPYTGIALSVDYAMVGESKVLGGANTDVASAVTAGTPEDGFTNPSATYSDAGGLIGAALDFNIGQLLGADYNVGVSVADRYEFGTKYNQFAATVYGGIDMVSAYVEYALRTYGKSLYEAADAGAAANDPITNTLVHEKGVAEHYLNVGVDLAVVENMNLNVYFGADDLADFVNQYFVGGNIGYTVSGIKFNMGVEYNASNWGAYNYDHKGLMLVPSVAVSF